MVAPAFLILIKSCLSKQDMIGSLPIMQHFDTDALSHLKKLARIDCTPEEEKILLERLKKVLGYISKLDEVNTEGVKPCSFVLSSLSKRLLRKDVVEASMPRDEFLAQAPDKIAGMIRVPPVLKSL